MLCIVLMIALNTVSIGLVVVQSPGHLQRSLPQRTQHPGMSWTLLSQILFLGLGEFCTTGVLKGPSVSVCGGECGIHFSWAMGWCRSSVMHILLRVMLYHPTRELLLLRSLPRRKLLRSKPGIIIPKLHERIKWCQLGWKIDNREEFSCFL